MCRNNRGLQLGLNRDHPEQNLGDQQSEAECGARDYLAHPPQAYPDHRGGRKDKDSRRDRKESMSQLRRNCRSEGRQDLPLTEWPVGTRQTRTHRGNVATNYNEHVDSASGNRREQSRETQLRQV